MVVKNCSTGYQTGRKKASFHFQEDQELNQKWIFFMNRKDWLPTVLSIIYMYRSFSRKICKTR